MARVAADRHEPHSSEAEEAVIGSCLLDHDAILRAREVGVQPSDFYSPAWGVVYEVMQELAMSLRPVDIVTVADALAARRNGDGRTILEHVGGSAMLTATIEKTPTAIHVAHYAGMVRDAARQRELIRACAEITGLAYNHEGEIASLYAEAGRVFAAAVKTVGARSHIYGSDEVLTDYLVNQQRREEELANNPHAQVKTGLANLDAMLGDIAPGKLHAIVARSSVGKTMYCEQLAEYNAMHGHTVAYYHLEQQGQDMLDRMICRHSGVSLYELRNGYHGPEVDAALDSTRAWFGNMIYVHCPGKGADWIAADIQRLHAERGLGLVVVDYLQKIMLPEANKAGLNSAQLWGGVVETLKTCAEVTGIPLVLGSQVRKSAFGNRNEPPTAEDIRNTGELEEKANQVVILHRKNPNEGIPARGSRQLLTVVVAKNTQGQTGETTISHIAGHYKLRNWEE